MGEGGRIRLDKWLWYARFFKTRGLSAKLVAAGHVRVNGEKVAKPATAVGPGDTLTFPQARIIRVVRIKDVGTRRFFRHLAGQGHVVMDVAYTLAPRAQLRAMVADVDR